MEIYPVMPEDRLVVVADVLKEPLKDSCWGIAREGQKCRGFPAGENQTCRVAIYIEEGRISNVQEVPGGQLSLETAASKGISSPWTGFTLPEGWHVQEIPPDQLLVPGFVDCHVHLVLDGVQGFKNFTGPVSDEIIEERLGEALKAGVVALRDGSDRYNTGLQARQLSLIHNLAGMAVFSISSNSQRSLKDAFLPLVTATGRALYRQGHYGSFLGIKGLNDMGEAQEKISLIAQSGSDQLKVCLSGLVSYASFGQTGPVAFSLEEMKTIVQLANEHNLSVMVHASSDEAVRTAVEAGVHSVEHGYFVSPETLHLMAEKNVAWIPTVAPVAGTLKEIREKGVQNEQVREDVIEKTIERHLEMINLAHGTGVTLGLGTDGGSPGVDWREGYLQEMSFYARAGLSPADILTIASENGAGILGLSGEMGTLEPGKKPYWLCLDKSILDNIDNYKGPGAVFCPCF